MACSPHLCPTPIISPHSTHAFLSLPFLSRSLALSLALSLTLSLALSPSRAHFLSSTCYCAHACSFALKLSLARSVSLSTHIFLRKKYIRTHPITFSQSHLFVRIHNVFFSSLHSVRTHVILED